MVCLCKQLAQTRLPLLPHALSLSLSLGLLHCLFLTRWLRKCRIASPDRQLLRTEKHFYSSLEKLGCSCMQCMAGGGRGKEGCGAQGRTLAGACWRVGKTQQCLLCRGQLANCRRGCQCIQIDSLVERKTIERGNHKGMMATLLYEGGWVRGC